MSNIKIKLAAGTDVGLVRHNNEDNFIISSDLCISQWFIPQHGNFIALGELGALLVVADGMGGALAGEVASAIAIDTIQKSFTSQLLKHVVGKEEDILDFMSNVTEEASLAIFRHSKEHPGTSGMGTTLVMAWLLGDKAYICWCGDSRCYVMTKQQGLIQLSKDHSFVQELVDMGKLPPERMRHHPMSNIITRCLGDVNSNSTPDTTIYQLHHEDCIMLCSDGLTNHCTDAELADVMRKYNHNPDKCKDELIARALDDGGYDNITVAIASIFIP